MVKNNLIGLGYKFKNNIIQRLELTTFYLNYSQSIPLIVYSNNTFKKIIKTLNIIFSQINNVNSTTQELKKFNILRKYLVHFYQGYCHSIGKPVRGQRT